MSADGDFGEMSEIRRPIFMTVLWVSILLVGLSADVLVVMMMWRFG